MRFSLLKGHSPGCRTSRPRGCRGALTRSECPNRDKTPAVVLPRASRRSREMQPQPGEPYHMAPASGGRPELRRGRPALVRHPGRRAGRWWSAQVPFRAPPGALLTVAVSTGGRVAGWTVRGDRGPRGQVCDLDPLSRDAARRPKATAGVPVVGLSHFAVHDGDGGGLVGLSQSAVHDGDGGGGVVEVLVSHLTQKTFCLSSMRAPSP